MMRCGFSKTDITPRVGVELCGFGPFLNRHSIGIRDRLWARAMAVGDSDRTVVLVSCDLIGLDEATVKRIRELVCDAVDPVPDAIMVHCTHTHSGPNTISLIGWGEMDYPYMEILPGRIADACRRAIENMIDATFAHAEVPCEGISLNREYDKDAPPLEEVLKEDWRPARPELTDTVCHVLTARDAVGRLIGFCSYFGCHPVVCCQQTRYIHGDYVGAATNLLECENPGSVGLFLQGAQGDVNSCVVHKPESESLLALDVVASRYADNVRRGLLEAVPVKGREIRNVSRDFEFSRMKITHDELVKMLAEKQAIVHAPGASDADENVRMATVYVRSIRKILEEMAAGKNLAPAVELQGFRIGEVTLLGAPFEIFQAIKNDVLKASKSPITLVLGITNGFLGYAPDRTAFARGGYAAQIVPFILGQLPFVNVHEELVRHLAALDTALDGSK